MYVYILIYWLSSIQLLFEVGSRISEVGSEISGAASRISEVGSGISGAASGISEVGSDFFEVRFLTTYFLVAT